MRTRRRLLDGPARFAAAVAILAAGVAQPVCAIPEVQVSVLDREIATPGFDDPAWTRARPASETFQQQPEEGKPATLATECRAIATPRALFLRFVLTQPAGEIVARELRRDADLSPDDRLDFILDTYRDRRNAYFFSTNPNGVRVDGLITEESLPSLDWDTVWSVAVRRTATGWEALFRIPFAALSLPGEKDGVWGFNFGREMRQRTEIVRWTGWERPWGISRVSHAGNLAGLPPLAARRLREATPYVAGAIDRRQSPSDTDLLGRAGLDVRLGLSSAIEADVTLNTDFAETEVDQQQFNFGRTALFFPEKRPFFLQRSQIFAFGDKDTTIPFFSRRIGLSGDEPVPLDAGVKLTGRSGRTEFGALAVQTREAAGLPRTDFLVGRVKEDIGHSSYVGALFTDVERASGTGLPPRSRTYGVDTVLTPTPDLKFFGYWVDTATPGISGRTSAWSADLFYTGQNIRGEIQKAVFGSAYDPEVGFVSQPGVILYYGSLGVVLRPPVLKLKEISADAFVFPTYNEDRSLHERVASYRYRADWLNGAYFQHNVANVYDENLTEPLELSSGATIAPGRYRFVRQRFSAGSDPSQAVSAQATADLGSYYDGRREGYTLRLAWRPNAHVAATVIENYNRVRLPGGHFNLSLFSARVDWNASVNLLSSLTVQSDDLDRLTNVQAIVRWLIDAGTDLFVVYNRQTGAGFETPGTRVTLKFRRTLDF